MLKAAVLSLVIALAMATSTAQASSKAQTISAIESYITATHHRQTVMGAPLTPTTGSYLTTTSAKYRAWVLNYWKHVNKGVFDRFTAPPNANAWKCILKYETGYTYNWHINTGNGYYGGLQMDRTFQSTYGSYLLQLKGTANNWTPAEQMWVAEHARASGRGYYPWPNTARACGLI